MWYKVNKVFYVNQEIADQRISFQYIDQFLNVKIQSLNVLAATFPVHFICI